MKDYNARNDVLCTHDSKVTPLIYTVRNELGMENQPIINRHVEHSMSQDLNIKIFLEITVSTALACYNMCKECDGTT